MQNGTGWKSAYIWGFPAQLPRLENPVTYSFHFWAPSVWGNCPVVPNLILLWIYAEWHWMKIRTNLGIPRTVAQAVEASYLFVLKLGPFRFRHLHCCPLFNFIVDLCRVGLDENPHKFEDFPHSCLGWRSKLRIRNKWPTSQHSY